MTEKEKMFDAFWEIWVAETRDLHPGFVQDVYDETERFVLGWPTLDSPVSWLYSEFKRYMNREHGAWREFYGE